MEALLVILFELLLPLFSIAFTAVAALAVGFLDLLFYIVTDLTGNGARKKKEKKSTSGPTAPIAKRGARGSLVHIALLAPLGLILVAGLLVQFVFFETTARWMMDRVAKKTGYEITFASATGSLLRGSLEFQNMTIKRPASTKTGFDLQVGEATLDIALTSLLFNTVVLQELHVDDVTGKIIKRKSAKDKASAAIRKPKRRFEIEDMRLTNVALRIEGGREVHQLEISSAQSQPFRSRLAVLDFFFRSNIVAKIDGKPLVITTSGDAAGRKTQWQFKDIPVASLTGLVDRAPVSWMNGGTLSGVLDDTWDLREERIDSDVKLILREVKIAAPADAGLKEKITAKALGKIVNARKKAVVLAFSFSLNEGDFQGATSLDAKAFGDALLKGVSKSLAVKSGETKEKVADKIKETGGALLRLLDKKK